MLHGTKTVIKHKIGLLNPAEELGKVSKALRIIGLSQSVSRPNLRGHQNWCPSISGWAPVNKLPAKGSTGLTSQRVCIFLCKIQTTDQRISCRRKHAV
jgi:hypothetical protein